MMRKLSPSKVVGGEIRVPGDKSIAQRAALLSILATGPISILNYPESADCQSALNAAASLGVRIGREHSRLTLTAPEKPSAEPATVIDCGNSGTTARLLTGLVAGTELDVVISGDQSLSSRPMQRIIDPLSEMGAEVSGEDGRLPLHVKGKKLLPFEYRLPIPSAQVKSSVLLAGLASGCSVTIREETLSRDHTENMLESLGVAMQRRDIRPVLQDDPNDPRKRRMVMPEDFRREIMLPARAAVSGGEIDIPGDFSTAAFFFGLAAISRSTITVRAVGLNPTRTAFLNHLKAIGCSVEIANKSSESGEVRGDVTVTGRQLKNRRLGGEDAVGMMDEIPMAAVIAAFTEGTTVIRNVKELRVKESDRIAAVAENLIRMGATCGVLEDGLAIEGKSDLSGADFLTFGDHRIAMAFSVAACAADGPSTLDDESCVAVSCPNFFDLLKSVTR